MIKMYERKWQSNAVLSKCEKKEGEKEINRIKNNVLFYRIKYQPKVKEPKVTKIRIV